MSFIYLGLGLIKLQSPCGSDAMVKSTVALLEAQNRVIQVAEGAILTYVNQETRTIIDKFSPQIQAAADLALAQLAQLQSRPDHQPIQIESLSKWISTSTESMCGRLRQ